jgi:pimeloyl-ACP methyl ester carboxylesterase
MEFETQTHDIDGVQTVVRVIGAGPALLALHGAATLEGQEFARGLADQFRVYLPFHPGFGDSAPAPHIFGMQDIVVHTLNLMDVLGLHKPQLMGHSMGGWLAAELAVVAGDRFGKLVLNAPAGLNDAAYPATDLDKVAPQDLPAYLAHNPAVALRYFPGGSDCPPPDVFGAARAKEGEALANILKVHGFGHPNLGRWIRRIRNDTLILWGGDDRMLPAGQAQIWADRIPNARLHIVPDAGHFAMQDQPACLKTIADFLTS